jgi:hypothetical protein
MLDAAWAQEVSKKTGGSDDSGPPVLLSAFGYWLSALSAIGAFGCQRFRLSALSALG